MGGGVAPLNMIQTSSAYLENGNNSMNLLNHHPNSVSGYVRIRTREIFGGERINDDNLIADSTSPNMQNNSMIDLSTGNVGIQSPLNIIQ